MRFTNVWKSFTNQGGHVGPHIVGADVTLGVIAPLWESYCHQDGLEHHSDHPTVNLVHITLFVNARLLRSFLILQQ